MAGAGHVNMMDDVLISHLPPVLLRSALRLLVSRGVATQRPFVEHIRAQLLESPPAFTDASTLFPPGDDGRLSKDCLRYVASTRCIFSSKLAEAALPYLTHFVSSLQEAGARWAPGDELDRLLDHVSGDIVQAIQALKECEPEPTSALFDALQGLLDKLEAVSSYCSSVGPQSLRFPFTRAERQLRDAIGFLYPGAAASLSYPEAAKTISISVTKRRADIETVQLGPYRMPRVFNGFWQLSSPAWGSASSQGQEAALAELIELGLSTADMADHYGDAELVYGGFRNRLPAEVRDAVHAATKWCVFGPVSQPVSTQYVLQAVQERSRRLGGRVELLQFHWHDYTSHEYLDILVELVKITHSHPDLVSAIGLCNFDAQHTAYVCEHIMEKTGTVGIVSNQVQFSLIDSRPLRRMSAVCEKYGIKLLTYGCFCGGFISSQWLGQPTPELYSETRPLTPSQRKYLGMVQIWGSWHEFQALLQTLSSVARKHGKGISLTNIAARWVLQQPAVGAVIIGTKLGVSNHAVENLNVFKFRLDKEDMAIIDMASLGKSGQKTKAVFQSLGDCGNEYRAMH
ncbi:hypothetical protein KVR01_000809 [Diaporthe batatas]|uniref:uncharacterized protein n=1 Tax=Diaporthe batatas TaxID=748121 RepID=UPI001D05B20B|nr:uncharacterized protein KVR01_000809 [Diaporthe batatas]KAG8170064.1 hypothetical protein KVR01_000809 [Diaporthe batatas]